jgi:uncharacterized repeat protein (TIGR01451 family)
VWLAVLAAVVLVVLAVAPAANAADRAFAPRFATNDTGDIDIVGNTLMTCPTSASGCTAARQSGVSTTADATTQNNAYLMQYIDVDADSATFNSSRATVGLPGGSTVLFAGLYWGARTAAGSGGSNARSIADRNKVKLRTPGASGYTALTADTVDDGTGGIYQGFKDVTPLVKAAGAGQYTVADVQASTGADTLAGWSLVVAYRDTTQPARNLSVFDGMKSISSGASGTIGVSGFTTPPAGAVRTRVGFVTYEGDGGLVGDSASLNGVTLSDAQHPATNFFNSRSSRDGVRRTTTDPNHANQLGIEQSVLQANGILGNGATSATVGLTSSGDVYAPGVVTFATELYAPKVEQTKTVEDLDGGAVEQGDVLRYTIEGTNKGQDGATNLVLRDPLPANTTYAAASLEVSPTAGGTPVGATDRAGDDRGEYDATNRRIVARLGTGSTATAGGTLAVNGTYKVTFDVRVGGPSPAVPSGTVIANTATTSFASQSLGTALSAESTATSTVASPDLTILKQRSGALVRGTTGTYLIAVHNGGDAPTQGAFTVTDALPAGLQATAASGDGWRCTVAAGDVTCVHDGVLDVDDAAGTITVTVDVTEAVPPTVANSATVSGGGDGDASNNTSTDTSLATSSVELGLTKTADATAVAVGGTVTYVLEVVNRGPSRSSGSTVTDTLPAGLTFVSSPTCTGAGSASTVTCAVPALDKGETARLTVVAKPSPGTAGSSLRNTASVVGREPGPASDGDAEATIVVKPVDLVVTNAIDGAPAALRPGATAMWNVTVKNTGTSPATGSSLAFPVPAGTTIAGDLPDGCTVVTQSGAQVVACDLGTIAPGGQDVRPLAIPLKVDAQDPPAAVQATATATSVESDADVGDNAATAGVPVDTALDLAVALVADRSTASAGDTLTLTATVRNLGPAPARDGQLVLPIPAGTTVTKVPAGCTVGDTKITCALDAAKLVSGGSVSVPITVEVGASPGDAVAASATVSTTGREDIDASNDTAAVAVPVVKVSGLSLTKTASTGQAKPGERVVYALTARNAGPAAARDAVVTDTLPAGTTFVAVDDAACAAEAGTVTCDFGTIAAGGSRTANVTVTVDPIASAFDVNQTHQYLVTKQEAALNVPAGATGTVTVSCAPLGPDYIATDGGVLRKATDQGQGSFADTRVIASGATDDGTGWTGTVRNATAGQLQATVNVVCIRRTVEQIAGHTHRLIVSDPVVATRGGGQHDIVVRCGPGRVAIAPGYRFDDGAGVVVGSRSSGADWRFTVDAREAAGVTVEARCLSTTTTATNGHAHDLSLRPIAQTVDVPASASTNAMTVKRLECGDGKGIVASTTIDPRLVGLGGDPQPVNRDFWFFNPTGASLQAEVGLLCLDTRTSGELPVRDVVNTATVSTSTQDASPAVHTASATFRATAASGPVTEVPAPAAPAAPPAPSAPAPAETPAPAPTPAARTAVAAPAPTATKATVVSSTLRVTGTATKATVAVPLRCATVCSGTARLLATKAVSGTRIRAGAVLATAAVRLVAGEEGTVRLVVRGALAKAIRRGRVSRARLVVRTGTGAQVTRTVRLVAR